MRLLPITNTNTLLLFTIISIGSLTALILIIIYNTPTEGEFFKYDPKYAHLVLLKPSVLIAKTKDVIPNRTCFNINNDTLNQYSEQFKNTLLSASQAPENSVWSDNFIPAHHEEYTFDISTKDALSFLGKYHFLETRPNAYSYLETCFFNYNEKQYIVLFTFAGLISQDTNFVNVNFTENNFGKSITNPNVTVYQRFNGSIIFNNNLDHDVIFSFTFMQPTPGYGKAPDDVRIPPGQSLPYDFDYYDVRNYATYPYLIKPDNLQGSVTVKNAFGKCFSMEEIKSLYSQIHIYPKFPQYLPDGYVYRCGMTELPNEMISLYGKSNASLNQPTNWTNVSDIYKNGGLYIDYERTNSFEYDQLQSEIGNMQKSGKNQTFPAYSEINGNHVILSAGGTYANSIDNINWIAVNTKDDYAKISGKFTITELEKIAESLK